MSVTDNDAWTWSHDVTMRVVVPTIDRWNEAHRAGSVEVSCPFDRLVVTQGSDGTDRQRDMRGKVDAYAMIGRGMADVSIRCQRDVDYGTFTLRAKRDHYTQPWRYVELDALRQPDTSHAIYMIQAYVNQADQSLLALYVCRTADLVNSVRQECAEHHLRWPAVRPNHDQLTGFHQIKHNRVPGTIRITDRPMAASVTPHSLFDW